MDYFLIDLLFILTIIITLIAQAYISASYSRNSKRRNTKGINGHDIAREILDKNGLNDIRVEQISGYLSDHYDPRNKTVYLSDKVYTDTTIASVAVAAHECGHALQDKEGYSFMRIRASLIPIVNIASMAGYISIVIGLFTGLFGLIMLGIMAECVIMLFQLVTLPVEFNASSRALKKIKEYSALDKKEYRGGKSVLRAAALTYVASLATSLIQIFRLILIARNRD